MHRGDNGLALSEFQAPSRQDDILSQNGQHLINSSKLVLTKKQSPMLVDVMSSLFPLATSVHLGSSSCSLFLVVAHLSISCRSFLAPHALRTANCQHRTNNRSSFYDQNDTSPICRLGNESQRRTMLMPAQSIAYPSEVAGQLFIETPDQQASTRPRPRFSPS